MEVPARLWKNFISVLVYRKENNASSARMRMFQFKLVAFEVLYIFVLHSREFFHADTPTHERDAIWAHGGCARWGGERVGRRTGSERKRTSNNGLAIWMDAILW